MLKNKFKILCKNFSNNSEVVENLWLEIYKKHTEAYRHYHTLEHLEAIYKEFETLEPTPIMEFAIFYHDIVYDVLKDDNEEKSAELAKNQLSILGVKKETIEKVYKLIIETKTHQSSTTQNELFLDADITILGSSRKNYRG